MATYAIGDIQGCYSALRELLDQLQFTPGKDCLWFAGDLVNRGPDSLATLRFIRDLGDSAVAVLGNHDLHLLAVAAGGKPGRRDTLDEVLRARDRDELLDWLRGRPLLHYAPEFGCVMVHAGLPPQWDLTLARRCAAEAESALRGRHSDDLLRRMYGDHPDQWDEQLRGWPRLRFIINCLTRLRYCTPEGRIESGYKGRPGGQPRGLVPWFDVPSRSSTGTEILFGHWSTLGQIFWPEQKVCGLDTGCVWGGALSALCLETRIVHSLPCNGYRSPDGAGD